MGSTALSTQLDPEELREVVRTYQETCTPVIQRYEGYIAQHLGDGLLVYFGYPVAHEDDAARAVRAGIGDYYDATKPRASASSKRIVPHGRSSNPLQVRIGIHTGLVVIGEIGSSEKREILALGETPNIAARVQGVAEPDTVVISAVTHRLVQGLFECQDLGPQTLKGISTPLSVYRVIGESAAQSRFEVAVGTGLTPLVGREEELGLLQRRWDASQSGRRPSGAAERRAGDWQIPAWCRSSKSKSAPKGRPASSFAARPITRTVPCIRSSTTCSACLQFAREDAPAAKLEKLQHTLSHYRFPQADTVPLLAALLSLPAS